MQRGNFLSTSQKHHQDLGSHVISMEFLHSLLRRFARAPVTVAISRKVHCFLRLCEFKRYALRLDSMLCELRAGYASYRIAISRGDFPGKLCLGCRKNHGCGQKRKQKRKVLALLCLVWGPLPNAANSNGVPVEFAAEL